LRIENRRLHQDVNACFHELSLYPQGDAGNP
jgi:hypothetical protein